LELPFSYSDLVERYGEGETYEMSCPRCSHPVEIITAGVHFGSSGSQRIYSEVDPFECPKCFYKEAPTPGIKTTMNKIMCTLIKSINQSTLLPYDEKEFFTQI
jgi:hypothetical protein